MEPRGKLLRTRDREVEKGYDMRRIAAVTAIVVGLLAIAGLATAQNANLRSAKAVQLFGRGAGLDRVEIIWGPDSGQITTVHPCRSKRERTVARSTGALVVVSPARRDQTR